MADAKKKKTAGSFAPSFAPCMFKTPSKRSTTARHASTTTDPRPFAPWRFDLIILSEDRIVAGLIRHIDRRHIIHHHADIGL